MSTRQARRRQQRVRQTGGRQPGGRGPRRPVSTTPWYLQWWAVVGAIAAVIAVIIIIVAAGQLKATSTKGAVLFNPAPAPANVLSAVENTSPSVVTAIGAGGLSNPWTALNKPIVTAGGKPVIDYDGAEYCPYCAADRWAIINALARFGTFTGLDLMKSQSNDNAGPSTHTFTFRNTGYTSPYLKFIHSEDTNNIGKPLQTPGSLGLQMNALNSGGGIPFLNLADRGWSSTTFQPAVLHINTSDPTSKALTWQEITADLAVSGSSVQQGIVGGGNWLTAGICKITGNKPASACNNPAITSLEAKVGFTK